MNENLKKSMIMFSGDSAKDYGVNIAVVMTMLSYGKKKSFNQLLTEAPFFSEKKLRVIMNNGVILGAFEKSTLTDEQAYEELNNGYVRGCRFCGYDRSFLDKHHYPVRAAQGGTDTINICANCHREFHQMTDYGLFALKGK